MDRRSAACRTSPPSSTVRPGGVCQVSYITLLFLALAVIAEIIRLTSSGFRRWPSAATRAAHLIGFHVGARASAVGLFRGDGGLIGVCAVAYCRRPAQRVAPATNSGSRRHHHRRREAGGGRGSILGVLLGLCVIGVIQNLIVLWGISPNWSQGVSGLVLIAAMTLTWLTRREGASPR